MDFNPLRYVGIKLVISVGDSTAFGFVWDEHGFGVAFSVFLELEGSPLGFVLYEQFNGVECYPSDDEDGA
jgi:hypothetical protein